MYSLQHYTDRVQAYSSYLPCTLDGPRSSIQIRRLPRFNQLYQKPNSHRLGTVAASQARQTAQGRMTVGCNNSRS